MARIYAEHISQGWIRIIYWLIIRIYYQRDLTGLDGRQTLRGRDESNRNARIVNGYLNGREQTSADVLGEKRRTRPARFFI